MTNVTDPADHLALRLVGIGSSAPMSSEGGRADGEGRDSALDHDAVLADTEEQSWTRGGNDPPGS